MLGPKGSHYSYGPTSRRAPVQPQEKRITSPVLFSISRECEEINAKYIFDKKTKVFLLTIIVVDVREKRVFFPFTKIDFGENYFDRLCNINFLFRKF